MPIMEATLMISSAFRPIDTRLATNLARVGSALPRSMAFEVTLTTRLMIHKPMMRTIRASRNFGP